MKVRELVNIVKNELIEHYTIFKNYENEWLDMDVDTNIPFEDFKEIVKEKVSSDCVLLNNLEYASYVSEDEKNILTAYQQGIEYIKVEDEIFEEYYDDNIQIEEPIQESTQPKTEVFFGDENIAIKPFKI